MNNSVTIMESLEKEKGKLNRKHGDKTIGSAEDKPTVITRSFFEGTDFLYEQVKHPKLGLGFARYNKSTDNVDYVDFIIGAELDTFENIRIDPIRDELVEKQAILLPTEAEPFGTVEELLNEIEAYIQKYCDLRPEFMKYAKWYVLLGAVSDKLNTIPYLRFLGDTGTGKSRCVDIIGRICYKPMLATACITPAPIYRMISRWGGTLILEEADIKQSDERNEVIKILNAGFERGKPVLRATKDNPDAIQALEVFCPKIFATRRRFDDAALEARCITEIMAETKRKDIPPLLPNECFEEQQRIRNKLLMFRFKYRHLIDTDSVLGVDFGDIEPRLKQVAASFAVIFVNFPDVLAEFKKIMEQTQEEILEVRSASFEGQVILGLIECIEDYVTNETDVTDVTLSSADIANKMPSHKGKPQDSRIIGRTLKILGLKTISTKVSGKTKRIIELGKDKLITLIHRYLPRSEQEEAVTLVTKVTSVTKKENVPLKNFLRTDTTFLKCIVCGESPCNYADMQRKPHCQICASSKAIQTENIADTYQFSGNQTITNKHVMLTIRVQKYAPCQNNHTFILPVRAASCSCNRSACSTAIPSAFLCRYRV